MATDAELDHRVAVLTNWGVWGSFGLCVLASGFAEDDYPLGVSGLALLAAGFIAHVIINRVWRTGFRDGEIATAMIAFGVAVLGFVITWIADPALSRPRVWLGLSGAVLAAGGLFTYLASRFGLRGAFSMFHTGKGA